jgi:chorismate mutase
MALGSRSHKADVDESKHEDKLAPDANLAGHASNAAYASAWRSGMELAEADARALGCVVPTRREILWDSEVTDTAAMREASAEEDPELDPTRASSEAAAPSEEPAWVTANALLSIEEGADSPAAAPVSASDDSDDESDGVPDVLPVPVLQSAPAGAPAEDEEIDPLRREHFMEAFDNLAADFAQPTSAPAAARSDPFVLLPGGGLIYKRQLVAQFNGLRTGEKISKDRLRRYVARGAQAVEQAVAAAQPSGIALQDAADDALDIGSDFAMAFVFNESKYEWWLGRVVAIFRAGRGKARAPVREALSLAEPLRGVFVVATWYKPLDGSRALYSHDSVRDKTHYPLEHYLGSPRLEYDATSGVYRLADAAEQIASLDDALRSTLPERAGSTRTVGEARAAERLRREQQQAAWATPGEGAQAAPSRSREAAAARRGVARVRQLQGADGRRAPPPDGS